MSAHAIYAPSSAHRWTACTASAEAIAQLGEQEEGEEAKEGTEAHDEIERLLGGLGDGVISKIATKYVVDPEHPAAYGVALVLDYVRQLPPGRLWIEQRVRLTDDIWGRCDVAHWHAESATLTIVDYKNGFVGVDAENNEQLQIYAAGSIYTHNLPAKWIRLVVVQPNDFRPVPRVKQHIMSADDIFAFAQRVAAIPAGPKSFVAGEQCKYCPLFGRCPASQDVLVKLGTMLANPADQVPAHQWAIFAACEKPIKDWFAAGYKAQTKAAQDGKVPPGMKLVQTQTKRAWKDEDAARDFISAGWGVMALDPPSPAQAEKLGVPKDDIERLATRPEGGPALAFENDKRPAWERKSIAQMFAGAVS